MLGIFGGAFAEMVLYSIDTRILHRRRKRTDTNDISTAKTFDESVKSVGWFLLTM